MPYALIRQSLLIYAMQQERGMTFGIYNGKQETVSGAPFSVSSCLLPVIQSVTRRLIQVQAMASACDLTVGTLR